MITPGRLCPQYQIASFYARDAKIFQHASVPASVVRASPAKINTETRAVPFVPGPFEVDVFTYQKGS
jgi:hypothetical protein